MPEEMSAESAFSVFSGCCTPYSISREAGVDFLLPNHAQNAASLVTRVSLCGAISTISFQHSMTSLATCMNSGDFAGALLALPKHLPVNLTTLSAALRLSTCRCDC